MGESNLRKIGFCGVDDSVPPAALGVIYNSYPFVEFGVLIRPGKEGEPRFASKEWLTEVGKVAASSGMTLAAHFCGTLVNDVLDGDDTFISTIYALGFRRIQINATAVNGVDTSNLAGSVPNLYEIIMKHDEFEFILQKNDETLPLCDGVLNMDKNNIPKNMTMLMDESKGFGVLPPSWPKPPSEYDIGYAGGIGPENITAVLTKCLDAAGGRKFWIDMESSLRRVDSKGNDVFDLNSVFQCIEAVCKLGLFEHPSCVVSK